MILQTKNLNWGYGQTYLPKSKLVCPSCGIQVMSSIDQLSAGHKYCILNGILNKRYANYEDWLQACKQNYDDLVDFFNRTI